MKSKFTVKEPGAGFRSYKHTHLEKGTRKIKRNVPYHDK
jgi:hypothetical protein